VRARWLTAVQRADAAASAAAKAELPTSRLSADQKAAKQQAAAKLAAAAAAAEGRHLAATRRFLHAHAGFARCEAPEQLLFWSAAWATSRAGCGGQMAADYSDLHALLGRESRDGVVGADAGADAAVGANVSLMSEMVDVDEVEWGQAAEAAAAEAAAAEAATAEAATAEAAAAEAAAAEAATAEAAVAEAAAAEAAAAEAADNAESDEENTNSDPTKVEPSPSPGKRSAKDAAAMVLAAATAKALSALPSLPTAPSRAPPPTPVVQTLTSNDEGDL
jgi:hypothetical protein